MNNQSLNIVSNAHLKLVIQAKGINIDKSLLENLKKYNSPNIESGGLYFDIIDSKGNRAPTYGFISEGQSPIKVIKSGKTGYKFCGTDYFLEFYSVPRVYQEKIDGINFTDFSHIYATGHMAVAASHYCYYFNNGTECKFCDIPNWTNSGTLGYYKIAKAAKMGQDYGEVTHISITTGTMPTKDRGVKGIIKLIEEMRYQGVHLPIAVESEPIEDIILIHKLKSLGVVTIACNIEFLKENVREELMPGKFKQKWENYRRYWTTAVELFGKNQVYSNVLLNSYDRDIDNTKKKLKEIIDLGVIPSIGILYYLPDKANKPIESLDVDFMLNVQRFNSDLLLESGMNPLFAAAGCWRNGCYSPTKEFYLERKEHWQ